MTPIADLDDLQVDPLLEAAMAAPSMHNTQPWRFDVSAGHIDVRVDRHRLLPAEDPTGRAAHIGVGAAVFNMSAAAETLGLRARVAWRPDRMRWDLLGRVWLESADEPDQELVTLATQIPRRHTARTPMLGHDLPERLRGRLSFACQREDAWLAWLSRRQRQRLLALTSEADVLESLDHARVMERAAWVGRSRHDGSGIPSPSLGPRPIGHRPPVRDLGVDTGDTERDAARFEAEPVFAVLGTDTDSPQDWLRAGMALERVLLTLTHHGLQASFLNQSLERLELRHRVASMLPRAGYPHMVLRVGLATPTAPTPRRRSKDVVGETVPGRRQAGTS